MSVTTAALLAALAMLISHGGNWLIGQNMCERPIVAGAITGLLLGDLKTGILIGAQLEAIYMGVVNIGGAMAAEPTSATVLAVAFTVWAGMDMETALTAVAIPVGLVANVLGNLIWFSHIIFSAPFDRMVNTGNVKGINFIHFLSFVYDYVIRCGIIFLAVRLGAAPLTRFLEGIPEVVMTGLNTASSLMGAAGMAILMKMLWSNELDVFYFAGFILVEYFGLPLVAVAAIAVIIVIPVAINDKKLFDLKKQIENGSISVAKDEMEEFFG